MGTALGARVCMIRTAVLAAANLTFPYAGSVMASQGGWVVARDTRTFRHGTSRVG
ncbi:MAG TPA: hypothetical protein PK725_00600 [Rhodocyclaceae bacterium]|nr:hypothetical protein [Rhodocyclaceae bacterium]HRQ45412.1 hypothetical protein [Rhodocyclaceae bacterium]